MPIKQKEIGVFKKMQKHICKQEIVFDGTFKAWTFSSNFNFICKDGRVTVAICKHYCPLVVNPTITNWCKDLHLEYGRVRRSVFEKVAMHKNKSFFLLFEMLPPLSKVIVFLCYFLQYDEIFLIRLLECCYHYLICLDPVNQWLFKVKITCKRVNFIKP